jgi:phosphomannomutase
MLKFGTGGLRGIMGGSPDQMNIATVKRATQGLATYIRKKGNAEAGVFIGFDSRHHSREFALATARVLAGNGIKVFLMPEIRPTPFVSFACRHKKCQAAVMITASHNPKEYNGYKVYWSDGAQVVPPHDTAIMNEVEAVQEIREGEAQAVADPDLDHAYIEAIAALRHFSVDGSSLKITYSSLHGTGITLMPQALAAWGFSSIAYVKKQIIPDGDFPTVQFPNPEYPETLQLGLKTLQETQSDILLVTDPDADRLAVAVMHENQPTILSGNEVASICIYFLCKTLSKLGKMPPNAAFITTIVTTELLTTIASSFQKPCFEVLTGFKYIGEKIHLWEEGDHAHQFLFGAEESYGYLLGTQGRDKDGLVSGCLIAEIALQLKLEKKTLVHLLHEIWNTYGIFREKQHAISLPPGKESLEKMAKLMARLRKEIPKTLGGQKVIEVEDFLKGARNLPPSDVLLIRLADQSKLVIRPSGTEPKLKIYASVHQKTFPSIAEGVATCDKQLTTLLSNLEQELSHF